MNGLGTRKTVEKLKWKVCIQYESKIMAGEIIVINGFLEQNMFELVGERAKQARHYQG